MHTGKACIHSDSFFVCAFGTLRSGQLNSSNTFWKSSMAPSVINMIAWLHKLPLPSAAAYAHTDFWYIHISIWIYIPQTLTHSPRSGSWRTLSWLSSPFLHLLPATPPPKVWSARNVWMQQILKSQLASEFTALCKQRKDYLTVIQVGLYQSAFKTGLYIPDIITVLEREKIWTVIEDNNSDFKCCF